jgi:hypothetical protein
MYTNGKMLSSTLGRIWLEITVSPDRSFFN